MKSKVYKPKEFIKNVLINEMKDIVFRHAYLSFALIAIGIEFLGKCMLTQYKNWYIPKIAFKKGLDLMVEVDQRYANLELKDQLRNGLVHTLLPKSKISLSEVKAGDIHFGEDSKGKTILVVEILYRDFVIACNKVLKHKFNKTDKMNKGFLKVYDL